MRVSLINRSNRKTAISIDTELCTQTKLDLPKPLIKHSVVAWLLDFYMGTTVGAGGQWKLYGQSVSYIKPTFIPVIWTPFMNSGLRKRSGYVSTAY